MNTSERIHIKTGVKSDEWQHLSPEELYKKMQECRTKGWRRGEESMWLKMLPPYAQAWWVHWDVYHDYGLSTMRKRVLQPNQELGWAMFCYVKNMHFNKSFRVTQTLAQEMLTKVMEQVSRIPVTLLFNFCEDAGLERYEVCMRYNEKVIFNHHHDTNIPLWVGHILEMAKEPLPFHVDNGWYKPNVFQHPMVQSSQKEPENIVDYLEEIADKLMSSSWVAHPKIWEWAVCYKHELSVHAIRYFELEVHKVLMAKNGVHHEYAPYFLTLPYDCEKYKRRNYQLSKEWNQRINHWYEVILPLLPEGTYNGFDVMHWEDVLAKENQTPSQETILFMA